MPPLSSRLARGKVIVVLLAKESSDSARPHSFSALRQTVCPRWPGCPRSEEERRLELLRRAACGATVGTLSRSPTFLYSHQQFAHNSCSICATKGGGWMETPIYGVLVLDPFRHSPLELVKSSGVHSVRGAGIVACRPGGTSTVNPGSAQQICNTSSQGVRGEEPATHACTRAEMPAPHTKE